jgi:hypothetical protein
LRTAALTLMLLLLAFTAAPFAFAETPQETAALQAIYTTKDGKHQVEIALPEATQPRGSWFVTLNGSDEQSSPEDAGLKKFTAEYDDLVPGRNYQVIAVFYGKDGEQPVDLDGCFQLQAREPASATDPIQLKDCGFDKIAEQAKKSDAAKSAGTAPVDDPATPSGDGNTADSGNSEQGTSSSEEETGTLHHMNSGQKESGGPMPDTAIDIFPALLGLLLFLLGCALLGFRSLRQPGN